MTITLVSTYEMRYKGLRDTVVNPLALTSLRLSLGNMIFCVLESVNRLYIDSTEGEAMLIV